MLSAKSALEVVLTGYSTEKILSCLKCGIGPLCDEEIFELEDYCFCGKSKEGIGKALFQKSERYGAGIYRLGQTDTSAPKRPSKRAVEPFLKLESELSSGIF